MGSIFMKVILIGCLIGFAIQLFEVGDRYLKFKTKTLIHMEIPHRIQMPSVSVCFRIARLLNRDKIKQDLNQILPESDNNWMNFFKILEKLTVKNIFDYTPSINETLSSGRTESNIGCNIRYPNSYQISFEDTSDEGCYDKFIIKKYIHRFNVCYKFDIKLNLTRASENNAHKLDVGENTLGPNLPGIMYWVGFDNDIFGNVSFVSASVHGTDTSNLFDSIFSPSLFHAVMHDADGKILNSSYLSLDTSYHSINIERLKAPYDTNCLKYDPFNSGYEKTLSAVRTAAVKRLKLVPTFDFVHERFEHPMISSDKIWNETIARTLREFIAKNRNSNPDCHMKYFITEVKAGRGENVRVTIKWPNNPNIEILYQSEQSILDLIIYTSSSLGLWFGLSVIEIFAKCRSCARANQIKPPDSSSFSSLRVMKALEAAERESKRDRQRIKDMKKIINSHTRLLKDYCKRFKIRSLE